MTVTTKTGASVVVLEITEEEARPLLSKAVHHALNATIRRV